MGTRSYNKEWLASHIRKLKRHIRRKQKELRKCENRQQAFTKAKELWLFRMRERLTKKETLPNAKGSSSHAI